MGLQEELAKMAEWYGPLEPPPDGDDSEQQIGGEPCT
jgi:hypothetical protein